MVSSSSSKLLFRRLLSSSGRQLPYRVLCSPFFPLQFQSQPLYYHNYITASRRPDLFLFDFSSFSSRAFFCSHPSQLGEEKGPAAIDYGRMLVSEEEFHKLADSTLYDLMDKFEVYGDSIQSDGFDIDFGNHVLTMKIANSGTYVINKQTPNRQIWLSSPVSSSFSQVLEPQMALLLFYMGVGLLGLIGTRRIKPGCIDEPKPTC